MTARFVEAGRPDDAPLAIQVVGKRVDISIGADWGAHEPRSQIVAIGAAGGVYERLLREKFEGCISAAAVAGVRQI